MDSRFVKLLTSIAFVFLGIMFFMHPGSITTLLMVALGVLALSYAAMCASKYFKTKDLFLLILAIILVIAGIILILQPALKWQIFDKIFGVVLALLLIVSGVFSLKDSRSSSQPRKYVEIILGVIVIIIGLVTLFRPSLNFLSVLLGIACVAVGGFHIYEFIREGI